MRHFGISAIRWNADRTDVAACKLHGLEEIDGQVSLSGGFDASHADVAVLIAGGHKVWVMDALADGTFERTRPVQVRGHDENLFTVPVSSLFELTEF